VKAYKILLYIFSVIAMLGLVSAIFPQNGVEIFEKRLLFPSPQKMIAWENHGSATEKSQNFESSLNVLLVQDSIRRKEKERMESLRNDTLQYYLDLFDKSITRFYLPEDDIEFFNSLFSAMENCRLDNSAVHILHYGDSQIEADRISGTLRHHLQAKFGGVGAGLQPLYQVIPSPAVKQENPKNVERYIIAGSHKQRASHNRYAILGQSVRTNSTNSIQFASHNYTQTFENTKSWDKVKLLVNRHGENFTVKFETPFYTNTKIFNSNHNDPEVICWQSSDSLQKSKITFSGYAELSAISLESSSGVFVDNIPLRGSSGTFFSQIDNAAVKMALNDLNVKLIILQFGGNALPSISSKKQLESYAKKIGEQILHFRNLDPQVKVLLIGPADMSRKIRGTLQTAPLLPDLVEALKNTALENGAAFWNMYEVMGGWGSMIEWVNKKPPLASPDYIHFTVKGANMMGNRLFEALIQYYDYYLFARNFDKPAEVSNTSGIAAEANDNTTRNGYRQSAINFLEN
jgi:lysophospholipase L1-like esterase